jgi:serine/threonine protein kinase
MKQYLNSGTTADVFKRCNKTDKCVVEKKPLKNDLSFEYKMLKLVYPLNPQGIIKPIDFKNKSIFLNYVNLNKSKIQTVAKLKRVLKSVITTLIEIQKKYPSFRHNDLHLDNVFISKKDKNVYMSDFGFANIQKDGFKNPLVQSGMYKDMYGIGPKPNKKYDIAYLINFIYFQSSPSVKKFIETLVPVNYLQRGNTKVLINGRMRYDTTHEKFPSLKKILDKL